MSKEKYFRADEFVSYIENDSKSSNAERIFLLRGLKYKPEELGGDGDFIADTGINLFNSTDDLNDLREFDDFDIGYSVPGHKLGRTAYFYVEKHDSGYANSEIVLSGRIVPYSPEEGIPMENRKNRINEDDFPKNGFNWKDYMKGEDAYLIENNIGRIEPFDSVEIGRLCRSDKIKGFDARKVVALGFKTLHKFIDEIGVKNYFDAAMDKGKRRYATLYEGVGMRKIRKYSCETVVKIEKTENDWKPVSKPLTYWAQHMNIPHTQERIRREFLQNEPVLKNGAKLNRKLIMFIAPYLFSDRMNRN